MRKLFLILSICTIVISEDIIAQQDSVWTLEKCIDYALSRNLR